MNIRRDPPGRGNLTFGKNRKKRLPIIPIILYLLVLVIAGVVFWQRERIQPEVMAMIGPEPTATPSAEELLTEAETAFNDWQLSRAATYYRQVLELDPGNVDVMFKLSRSLLLDYVEHRDDELLDESLAVAEEIITIAPEDPRGYAAKARALTWMGEYADAASAAGEAISTDPEYALGYAYLAEAQINMGRLQQSLDSAERAIEKDPYSPDARGIYAWVLANYGQYQQAIIQYEQALRLEPGRIDLMYELALNYRWLGGRTGNMEYYDKSVESFEGIVRQVDNDLIFIVEIGKTYFEIRDDAASQEYLQDAVRLVCEDCPETQEIWDMTQAEYEAWKDDPTLPEDMYIPAWFRLGQVYFSRRNYEDAIDILEETIAYAEAKDEELNVEPYYVTATAYYYKSMCHRAVPYAVQALNLYEEQELNDAGAETNILSVFVLCRDYVYEGQTYIHEGEGFVNGFPEGYTEPNVIVESSNGQ